MSKTINDRTRSIRNIDRLKLPIHRLVNRNGLLTGRHHYDTTTQMQELLESEGIEINDNQVQNLQNVVWNPLIDL
jgi:methylated-DNA-protein-cysteine methyltransferase-like protein